MRESAEPDLNGMSILVLLLLPPGPKGMAVLAAEAFDSFLATQASRGAILVSILLLEPSSRDSVEIDEVFMAFSLERIDGKVLLVFLSGVIVGS